MPQAEYDLLESVIKMTEEHNKKSFEKILVETLANIIHYDVIHLYHVPAKMGVDYVEISIALSLQYPNRTPLANFHEHETFRLQRDQAITSCIVSKDIVIERSNDIVRTLFPIIIHGKVTEVVEISCKQFTREFEKEVRDFIHIYKNFSEILFESEHDTLTGLLNRKTFDANLLNLIEHATKKTMNLLSAEEARRHPKDNAHHWIGILDIDFFKDINDKFGHLYGDEVLLIFADLMRKKFRSNDLLFRYGGEEFVVVLSPATEADAFDVFERFRKALAEHPFSQIGHITASIGMVKISVLDHHTSVLECADKALYYAKEHGRNQVQNYHTLVEQGLLSSRTLVGDVELF